MSTLGLMIFVMWFSTTSMVSLVAMVFLSSLSAACIYPTCTSPNASTCMLAGVGTHEAEDLVVYRECERCLLIPQLRLEKDFYLALNFEVAYLCA